MTTFLPFAPAVCAVIGGAVAMLLDAWGRPRTSVAVSLGGLCAGAVAALFLLTYGSPSSAIASVIVFSPGGLVCLVAGAIAVGASTATLAASPTGPRIAVLSAFAAAAAAVLAGSADLGVLFLSVEGLALCGYGLVALSQTDRAREAAMKWFVQGSVATAFLIVGLGVIISRTGGSLGLDAVRTAAAAPATSAGVAVGLVLILSALAFKAGAFPFHSWMPDALETAPPAAAAVLASAGKVGPVAAAVWLVIAVKGTSGGSALAAIALIAVASIVFGNLAALRQRSLARMLAYSAIAQIGYAFAGLPAGNGSGPALIFILLYALTSVASFVFIVAMGEVEPDWDGSIGGLAGLSRRHPALTASLAVIMLSLTGIPLTAGFWGKFLVFGTIATHGYLWLAIVGVLGSVVSFGYYGGVLRAAFMDEGPVGMPATGATPPVPGERRRTATSATVVLALAIVVIGLVPFVTGLGVFGPLR